MKKIAFALISMTISIVMVLIAAEILLRFLPYNQGLRVQPVNPANPILHFEPNRSSNWSLGWNFAMVNRGVRTNNYGFRSDYNYDPTLKTPLLAVIGDSNIESLMLPFPETTPARLAAAVAGKGRIYNFSASGAGFGQHLAWIQYARDTFRPDAFVVLVISNDYQEALYKYKRDPAFHYLRENADGLFELVRVDYQPGFIRRTLRRSALFMYLALNVQAYTTLSQLFEGDLFSGDLTRAANGDAAKRANGGAAAPVGGGDAKAPGGHVANMPAHLPATIINDMKRGVDAYLDQFADRAGVDRSRVLFVVDGLRTHLYDAARMAEAHDSMAQVMNQYFIEQARARGYEAVDMTPLFVAQYARDRRKFEFPLDFHLNGHGHDIVSKTVIISGAFRRTFDLAR